MGNTYLHGDLTIKIAAARALPKTECLPQCFSRRPNVVVYLGPTRLAQTHAATSDPMNPSWNQLFNLALAHNVSELISVLFEVKDTDAPVSKTIGTAQVPINRIASGERIDEWFPVEDIQQPAAASIIRLQITFLPCSSNPIFSRGISVNYATRGTYFPLRRGGGVTLYQDAHVGVPHVVRLDGGRVFRNEQCWQDMCSAILEAKRLIYITGWSVYYKTKLVREPTTRPVPDGSGLTLGELLKRKANEGVRVVLMIWDDPTSVNMFHKGMMQTHDEETRKFFKHSPVTCVLVSRSATRLIYSHHQKCVILDTKDGNNRKITAFLGGLDLCHGRYDTPEHRLFRDLDTIFEDDFYNGTYKNKGARFPRQPWHDLHCRIEGPAAWDVLTNYEQRWAKATVSFRHKFKKLNPSHHDDDDYLIDVENDPLITKGHPSKEDDPERWHVQIFRSIDSESLEGFPTDVNTAEEQNLAWIKNRAVDKSIQNAYIQAIRSAQHFVYIENQYFIGSSFAWPSFKDAGAENLIPMELALKIASKIRANERFSVYVVIPMWPEGEIGTWSVTDILHWQRLTMQMMYNVVAQEIKIAKLEDAHPTDYLNFYCLGNREDNSNSRSQTSSGGGGHDTASQKYGRFMVYVHSKGMIVDDAYVILGSANINERSMSGRRDTEIAMGSYQPHYTWANKKQHPRGQVYGYRMSLWAEHIGRTESCFDDPENIECVNYVNGVAEENWKIYTDDGFTRALQGHILKYPMEVDADGNAKPLVGHEGFPDVGGVVEGRRSVLHPSITT